MLREHLLYHGPACAVPKPLRTKRQKVIKRADDVKKLVAFEARQAKIKKDRQVKIKAASDAEDERHYRFLCDNVYLVHFPMTAPQASFKCDVLGCPLWFTCKVLMMEHTKTHGVLLREVKVQ